MGNSNQIANAAHIPYGQYRFFIQDDDKSTDALEHWHYLGKTNDPDLGMDIQKEQLSHFWEGQMTEIQERITGSSCELTIGLQELMKPNVLQFLLGDKQSSLTEANPDVIRHAYEEQLFFTPSSGEGKEHKLPFGTGTRLDQLPACASYTGTVSVTGGANWTPGTYYSWVIPVHLADGYSGSAPGKTTLCDTDKLDVEWILGTPSDETAGTSGYQGKSHTVANADDKIAFAITDNTGVVAQPDYYAVFVNTSNTITGSVLAGLVARDATDGVSDVSILDPTGGDTYVESHGIIVDRNTGTKDSPSYSALTKDTDYTWDRDRGIIKPVEGGAITQGMNVRIRYFSVKPYEVSQFGGPTGMTQDLRTVHLLCLEPEADGPTPLYPEGVWITVFRCNTAGIGARFAGQSASWYEGQPVTLRCLQDFTQNGMYFKVRSLSNTHRGFAQQFE